MNLIAAIENVQNPPHGKPGPESDLRLDHHISLLREKIGKIVQESDPKDDNLALRLQKTIFKSRIRPEIRRKISGAVAEILRNLPGSARNDRTALRARLCEATDRFLPAIQPENVGEPLTASIETADSEGIFPIFHQSVRETILGGATGFETTEEAIAGIGERDEFWYVLLLEILETPQLRLRDLRLHRYCEFLVFSEIAKRETTASVLSAWVLKILTNPESHAKYGGMDAKERESFWALRKSEAEAGNQEGLPLGEFVGPRLGERKKAVRISERSDVPADFAWAVDLLVRKFEKSKRDAVSE